MKLEPINNEGYKLIADGLNEGIDQYFIYFNTIIPVRTNEIPTLFSARNMIGYNLVDKDGLCAVGGLYGTEIYGNRLNGKMWAVIPKENTEKNKFIEIIKCLKYWAFNSTASLHKIIFECRSDKGILAETLQRLGFKKEGELDEQVRIRKVWRSIKIYGLIADKDRKETKEESGSVSQEEISKILNLNKVREKE